MAFCRIGWIILVSIQLQPPGKRKAPSLTVRDSCDLARSFRSWTQRERRMSNDDSPGDHSVTLLIERLKAEDPRAAEQIWRRYFERLLPMARSRLRGRANPAADEEDVLVSVFDRFFRATKEDR